MGPVLARRKRANIWSDATRGGADSPVRRLPQGKSFLPDLPNQSRRPISDCGGGPPRPAGSTSSAKLLSAVLRKPGDYGLQLDRNVAFKVAPRAIILRIRKQEKARPQRPGFLFSRTASTRVSVPVLLRHQVYADCIDLICGRIRATY